MPKKPIETKAKKPVIVKSKLNKKKVPEHVIDPLVDLEPFGEDEELNLNNKINAELQPFVNIRAVIKDCEANEADKLVKQIVDQLKGFDEMKDLFECKYTVIVSPNN